MPKLGYQFEKAVFNFIKTLDPSAEVRFDQSILDRDTGTPRQCDVWINAKFGGHWPLSILVSCKDRRKSGRKLDISHIGTFCDEKRSTGADMGVIYCNTGFTQPAIKKAKNNNIACCRLYENEPSDIPEAIWLNHFACAATVQLGLNVYSTTTTFNTWNDIFNLQLVYENKHETVLDVIHEVFHLSEKQVASKRQPTDAFPSDWHTVITFKIEEIRAEFQVLLRGHWKRYRAKSEAILLDGSYCFSDQSFRGGSTGPLINIQATHPGKDWVEIDTEEMIPTRNIFTTILMDGDTAQALRDGYGTKSLNERNRMGLCQKDLMVEPNIVINAKLKK